MKKLILVFSILTLWSLSGWAQSVSETDKKELEKKLASLEKDMNRIEKSLEKLEDDISNLEPIVANLSFQSSTKDFLSVMNDLEIIYDTATKIDTKQKKHFYPISELTTVIDTLMKKYPIEAWDSESYIKTTSAWTEQAETFMQLFKRAEDLRLYFAALVPYAKLN